MTSTQERAERSWLWWLGWLPAGISRLRRDPPPEHLSMLALTAAAVGITLGGVLASRNYFAPSLLALVLLFGGLLISRRGMLKIAFVVAGCLAAYITDIVTTSTSRPFGLVAVVGITGLVAYEFARSRDETGMAGMRADSMLVELRRRLEDAGRIPPLPPRWQAELVIKPAGGGPFAGDFVVSHVEGDRLEIVLADVSGKGVEAGTRALLLSGALGGLVGTKDFLGAANTYLVRQDWTEGFATAAHLVLDLETGGYEVSSAGHPPVVHFDAGKGLWDKLKAEGPALGLLPDVDYEPCSGQLRPGDALLLYTDGLVEVPGRDLDVGIDKLLGEAERLVTRGFAGGGEVLVNRVSDGSADDRGLILLWRSPHL
ncbi:MAG: protein phosphatase [Frankiales bacterium]|nr:protein phosphatase [Frankiales bacterium]